MAELPLSYKLEELLALKSNQLYASTWRYHPTSIAGS
jgi:hypothetical protein